MNPNGSRFAPAYDFLKLIVVILLTVIFLILLNSTRFSAGDSKTFTAATSTSAPGSTETAVPSVTTTQLPTLVPTNTVAFTPTAEILPELPTSTPTTLPIVPTEIVEDKCPSAETRIKIGDKVRVQYRLNFRRGPGLSYQIIQTNAVGTDLEVIDGPICTTLRTSTGDRAYMWWKVRMVDGLEGWSAEAPLIYQYYFLGSE